MRYRQVYTNWFGAERLLAVVLVVTFHKKTDSYLISPFFHTFLFIS